MPRQPKKYYSKRYTDTELIPIRELALLKGKSYSYIWWTIRRYNIRYYNLFGMYLISLRDYRERITNTNRNGSPLHAVVYPTELREVEVERAIRETELLNLGY